MATKLLEVLPKYTIILDTKEDFERKAKIELISDQLSKLNTQKGKMYGFEGEGEIDAAIKKLEQDKKHLEIALKGYPDQLSVELLAMVNPITQLPLFMVLGMNGNVFRLEVDRHNEDFSPNIPRPMRVQYQKTINRLRMIRNSVLYKYTDISISAKFEGEMSDEDREDVRKAEALHIFDNIYMIAEAPSWKFNSQRISKTDPVVIGWIESTQQAFVIKVFNPTENESFAMKLFSKHA